MAITIKPSRKGLLHKKLGVPEGEKIPAPKLQKALHSKSAAERKEANFARNARKFRRVGRKNLDDEYRRKPTKYDRDAVLLRKDME
jgi:hypothetical protein